MNKNAIQKYAIWARNELIEQVKQRAYQYGISDEGYGDENAAVIAGRVLTSDEKRQRAAFVDEIKENGFEQAVEEVAYTWFNRFVALRFMEINDYLPTHVRVFSDASGGFNPEILKDVLHLELEGLDKAKVSEMLNASQTEELYRYLLLTQCNALNDALPEMFEKLGTYTEMLLPNNILKQDSVLARLVKDIEEDDWKDAVQIIGWMYQYYNTEPKQAVFDGLKKNVKITKEKIPAATQLFTPDWIVRHMVENSLGRLWLESHPNDALKANWKYYLDEAKQTPEVADKLRVLRSQSPVKSPEDIRLIDPCMGSGHILVYAFDVLMQIYESEGYNPRDAAKLILEKNIYGLDIDCRAYQLAYFSLMMKARQYNRRIFTDGVKPQVYHPAGFPDGEEYGSLVKVDALPPKPVEKTGQLSLEDTNYALQLNAWNFKRLLAQKYDVVITNPPYMGNKGFSNVLLNYITKNYLPGKIDLYAVFILRCHELLKDSMSVCTMITPESWMFLSRFEKMRQPYLKKYTFTGMLHLGFGAFDSGFGTTCFTAMNINIAKYNGKFLRLVDVPAAEKETQTLTAKPFISSKEVYYHVDGVPFCYWVSNNMVANFANKKVKDYGKTCVGLLTGDNERFLRYWFEIGHNQLGTGLKQEDAINSAFTWFPINQYGEYRKWYGNNLIVFDWKNNGEHIKKFKYDRYLAGEAEKKNSMCWNEDTYFHQGITWNRISTDRFSARYSPTGNTAGSSSPIYFITKRPYYALALFNSAVFKEIVSFLNPTVSFQTTDIEKVPIVWTDNGVDSISEENILLSHADWDAFEISWDFKRHPLICGEHTVVSAFGKWEREAVERFDTLKANEEELNRIFIDIYGLQDELTPEVEDKDVTVSRADLGRDIRSFISYAVGCMFGRYSLDIEGLAYAGGDWDAGKYLSFIPDKDNILPICDDEYFDDDIVGVFVDFIRVVYGAETLEENLKFIAEALGGKGTPREVIRNYFLNDFYKDHCKIYQKRPIYWLFDSGKKNGFKSLVYLHRYQSDLLARLRTDYVHEQQERYRTQLSHIDAVLNTAVGSERARLLKQQNKMSEQLKEITVFEEKVHHLADQNIEIDLDDGVKKNYEIFKDVLAKI